MKIISKIFILVFFVNQSFAQSDYSKLNFSVGYGFPNIPKLSYQVIKNQVDIKNFSGSGYGPIHFKAEFLPHKRFGVGLSINHNQFKFNFEQDYFDSEQLKIVPNHLTLESKKTAINLRLNFHILDLVEDEDNDLYIGLGAGYNAGKNTFSSDINYIPDIKLPRLLIFSIEGTIGYRHYFGDLGIYGELGYAKSLVQFGLNYRIR